MARCGIISRARVFFIGGLRGRCSRNRPENTHLWGCFMIATPRELLDTSIAQLRMLTAFLGDQLADSAVEPKASDTPDILACREILVSLGALIVKVQATSRPILGRVRSEQVRPDEKWHTAYANGSVRGRSRSGGDTRAISEL